MRIRLVQRENLPEGFSEIKDVASDNFQLLESGQWEVIFSEFADWGADPIIGLAEAHFADDPPRTLPALRLAVYNANTHGLNWSMSAKEARQYTFCMNVAPLMNLATDGHVEYYSDGHLDVLIELRESRTMVFWQLSQDLCGGTIDIKAKEAAKSEKDEFSRILAQSLSVIESGAGKTVSPKLDSETDQ